MKFDPTLYLVTDSSLYEEDAFLSVIDGVCSAGITLLQLREKERSTLEAAVCGAAVLDAAASAALPGVSGPGSLRSALADGLWNLLPEQLCKYCEIEEQL